MLLKHPDETTAYYRPATQTTSTLNLLTMDIKIDTRFTTVFADEKYSFYIDKTRGIAYALDGSHYADDRWSHLNSDFLDVIHLESSGRIPGWPLLTGKHYATLEGAMSARRRDSRGQPLAVAPGTLVICDGIQFVNLHDILTLTDEASGWYHARKAVRPALLPQGSESPAERADGTGTLTLGGSEWVETLDRLDVELISRVNDGFHSKLAFFVSTAPRHFVVTPAESKSWTSLVKPMRDKQRPHVRERSAGLPTRIKRCETGRMCSVLPVMRPMQFGCVSIA